MSFLERVKASGTQAAREVDHFQRRLPQISDEQRLDAVEQLIPVAQEAGLPMTHLAIAFAIAHPGVTSAIIGPRTMEQLDDLVAATEVTLTDEILDQIDSIVPPGTNIGTPDEATPQPRPSSNHTYAVDPFHNAPPPNRIPPRAPIAAACDQRPPTGDRRLLLRRPRLPLPLDPRGRGAGPRLSGLKTAIANRSRSSEKGIATT